MLCVVHEIDYFLILFVCSLSLKCIQQDSEEDAAKNYFDVFDLDSSGFIDIRELETVLSCLFDISLSGQIQYINEIIIVFIIIVFIMINNNNNK